VQNGGIPLGGGGGLQGRGGRESRREEAVILSQRS
jgi:hypothetical protein